MEKKKKSEKITVKKINTFLEGYADKDLAFDPKKKSNSKNVAQNSEIISSTNKQVKKVKNKKELNAEEKINNSSSRNVTLLKTNEVEKKHSNNKNKDQTFDNQPNNIDNANINKKENIENVSNSNKKPVTTNNNQNENKPQKANTLKEKKVKKTKQEKIEERKKKRELRLKIRKIKSLNKPHYDEKNIKPKNYDKDSDIIVLENVNKHMTNGYSCEHILKDVSLRIKKGEFVVIYGPSGSGKTTLLTLISALDRPSNGICYMFNKNTISLNESQLTKLRSEHVGYIFQQYGLLTDLSVYDNIKLATSLQPDKKKLLDIDELLKSVDLLQHKYKKASNLSGGQAQRVAICRALVRNPDILYGDEPTGAIHIDATKQIMNIFCNINQKFKTTVVIVTHNEKILELGDHIIKVDSGRIIEDYINKNKKTVAEILWE